MDTSDSSLINLLISPAVGFTTNSAGDSGGVIDTSDSSFINITSSIFLQTVQLINYGGVAVADILNI